MIEMLCPIGTGPRPGKKLRAFRGVTIHDTANESPTADAVAHAKYLLSNPMMDKSWHYCVDENETTRSIPEDEVSWHASDGSEGPGNNETISMETCVNAGSDYGITMKRAAALSADILFRHGFKSAEGAMFQHYDWAPDKKNCPRYIRDNGLWDVFVDMVEQELQKLLFPAVIYRVQTGAFVSRVNAETYRRRLEAAGFSTYMVMSEGFYKVQVGAFTIRENAVRMAERLKATGFANFITTKGGEPVTAWTLMVGSTVKIRPGAASYEGVEMASFVYNNSYRVDALEGDRAVLSKTGINTAFHTSDLIIV